MEQVTSQAFGLLQIATLALLLAILWLSRSGWSLPLGALVLLPALQLTLVPVPVGGRDFNVTPMDLSLAVCLGALVLRAKAIRRARSTVSRGVWRAGLFSLLLIGVLLFCNALGNLVYQAQSHWVMSSIALLRIYCQAYLLPFFLVVFLRAKATRGVVLSLSGFSILSLIHAFFNRSSFTDRATPFGMNPNAYGQVLALMLACVVPLALERRGDRLLRYAALAAVPFAALGIVISGSREGVAGAAAGMTYAILRSTANQRAASRLVKLGALGVLVAISLQITAGMQERFDTVFVRMENIIATRQLGADDNFASRLQLATDALEYYAKEPVFVLTGRGLMAGPNAEGIVYDADSAYVNTLNAVGIFGLGSILFFIAGLWRKAGLGARLSASAGGWTTCIRSAVLTYVVLGFAANVFGSPHTTMVFLVVTFTGLLGIDADRRSVPVTVSTPS